MFLLGVWWVVWHGIVEELRQENPIQSLEDVHFSFNTRDHIVNILAKGEILS